VKSYRKLAVYRWSGLARTIDPAVPSNRALIWIAAGSAGMGLLLRAPRSGLPDGLVSGATLPVLVVVVWALTRELVPDRPGSAFAAVALALASWIGFGDQSILLPGALLAVTRLANRSTGRVAARSDSVGVFLLFSWVAWTASWSVGLIGGGALLIDGSLPPPGSQEGRPGHRWVGLAVIAVAGASALARMPQPGSELLVTWPALVLVTLAGLIAAATQKVSRSVGDVDGVPLSAVRVRAASVLGVLGMSAATAEAYLPAPTLAAGWAAVVGLVIGRSWPDAS
jgi:hypothetical protein